MNLPKPNFLKPKPAAASPPMPVPPKKAAPASGAYDSLTGIEGVSVRETRNEERTGDYIERIDSVREFLTKVGETPAWGITKTILAVLREAEDGHTHAVGEQVSQAYFRNPKYPNYYKQDVLSFIVKATGCDPASVTSELAHAMAADDQPMAGLVVECHNSFRAGKGETTRKFVQVNYIRRVLSTELPDLLAPQTLAEHFPPEVLTQMAASEA